MKMRAIHRYLGFFLAGIMAIYALSGIVLIFRDSEAFKVEKKLEVTVPVGIPVSELGDALEIKRFKIDHIKGDIVYFKEGTYNQTTRKAEYLIHELPYFLDKMTHLHKAKSSEPLMVLNIMFGLSLLFFVISSFWMFLPGTNVFKKGMFFALGGFVLALILLFV